MSQRTEKNVTKLADGIMIVNMRPLETSKKGLCRDLDAIKEKYGKENRLVSDLND